MWVLSTVAAASAAVLGLASVTWAADDGGTPSELPRSPVVTIETSINDDADDDMPDETDDPEALDEFQHYIDLVEASEELKEYLDNLEYGLSNGTGALILPGLGDPTSPYGERVHPISGASGFHTGLDLDAGDGVIYAADSGTVVQAATNSVYGNYVVLDHGLYDGRRLTTMYAHQADLQVDAGDRVSKGQPIGEVGSTGVSTGPHLHFEVRLDGSPVNPAAFLPPMP